MRHPVSLGQQSVVKCKMGLAGRWIQDVNMGTFLDPSFSPDVRWSPSVVPRWGGSQRGPLSVPLSGHPPSHIRPSPSLSSHPQATKPKTLAGCKRGGEREEGGFQSQQITVSTADAEVSQSLLNFF